MKKITASIITLLLIGFLFTAVSELPEYGRDDNPSHNEVYDKYVNDSIEDTGAINIVAAIILDYRAFDTFIEATVIFTALIVVMTLLKKGGLSYED